MTDDNNTTGGSDDVEIEEFVETTLPDGVTVEDALRAFMEVDPDAVKEAEEEEKEAGSKDDSE